MVIDPRTPAERIRQLFWNLVPTCRVGSEGRTPEWIEKQLNNLGSGSLDRLARYLFATGLLAYGRLDMSDVILDNVPTGADWGIDDHASFLGCNAINTLLPLPGKLKSDAGWRGRLNTQGIRLWLKKYHSQLTWDEQRGQFVLE